MTRLHGKIILMIASVCAILFREFVRPLGDATEENRKHEDAITISTYISRKNAICYHKLTS